MSEQASPGRSWPIKDWCRMRGWSRPTAYRLIRDGELKTIKVRGRRYVTEAEDRAFIARKEHEASA